MSAGGRAAVGYLTAAWPGLAFACSVPELHRGRSQTESDTPNAEVLGWLPLGEPCRTISILVIAEGVSFGIHTRAVFSHETSHSSIILVVPTIELAYK